MTNQELADAIGVSASMASRLRNGHRLPGVEVLGKLAEYLDVDLERMVAAHAQGTQAFGVLVRGRLLEREL